MGARPRAGAEQRTLERLLDATEQLLEHQSFRDLRVQDVVAAARSSVGSFYARFDSKDALLHTLHERYVGDSQATTADALAPERWEGVPLADIVDALAVFLVDWTIAHRGMRRALVEASTYDADVRARAATLAAEVCAALATLFEARRDEHLHPDPALAGDIVHRLVFSFLDQVLIFTDRSPTGRELSAAQMTTELSRAVKGYLGVLAAAPAR